MNEPAVVTDAIDSHPLKYQWSTCETWIISDCLYNCELPDLPLLGF